METAYGKRAKRFQALYDEKRLRIRKLLRGGEKCACAFKLPTELTIPIVAENNSSCK